jgi:carboxymethylenebutenolidase
MGHRIELSASDGHRFSAYLADPGNAHGAVVVLQEIFGVTRHIREVADQYAAAGFLAIAPALFDRTSRDADVPYSDFAQGVKLMQALKNENVMLDIQAAIDRVGGSGKVAVVGFCWGGTMAYLAAARLDVAAAVAYYGGGIHLYTAETPRAPILFHFGEKDSHIPLSTVDAIKAAVPNGVFYVYPADHGFNCTDRSSFEPTSAKLALDRSLEFLHRHVG